MVAGIFFVIGYKTAYDRIEAATTTLESQTFYASISDIRDSTLSVQGMDVNDINFRGDFVLNIVEETKIVWRYTELSFEDLDVGDKIAVTFSGDVLESSPAQITQVEQIQLLDDEI
ncbi:DUF3221 domain-containing protein [Lachnoclostridium sp. An298]|nr:DUF3221 domain-containing protein [Lachnoclostridium sp. An298]